MFVHAVTGTFLRHIRNRESDRCFKCDSRSRIDVYYIMFRCVAWKKKHTLLRQEHDKQVVQ